MSYEFEKTEKNEFEKTELPDGLKPEILSLLHCPFLLVLSLRVFPTEQLVFVLLNPIKTAFL